MCFVDSATVTQHSVVDNARLSLHDMVVVPSSVDLRRSTFRACQSISLPEWERQLSEERVVSTVEQEQQVAPQSTEQVSLALRDKFGLFLSVCSLLVSIQYFIPRTL